MKKTVQFLLSLKGNAKPSVLTEPLWGIPANLYAPFVTLYMYHLGVLDFQIGIILFVGRLVQVFMALIAGVITDKFGRRITTLIGDFVSWSIPALIWAFSQNFWWFLAGAIVNAIWHITAVSWECLWVDDTPEDQVGPIYNWIYISGLLAVFFAPIAGYFVSIHGVVPVTRMLYLFAFVSMTCKFVLLYVFSTETKRGIERMEATKDIPMLQMFKGYKVVIQQILKSKVMVKALALQIVLSVTLMVTSTFFALYATQNLFVPESFLALFPMLRAGIMLVFLLFIQEKLSKYKPYNVMVFGLGIYVSAMIWLLVAPEYSWMWVAVYIALDACAAALLLPRMDALVANAIDPEERARIRSLFNMVIMAVSGPFAILAGALSDIDRRLPFALNVILFLIMVCIVIYNRKEKRHA